MDSKEPQPVLYLLRSDFRRLLDREALLTAFARCNLVFPASRIVEIPYTDTVSQPHAFAVKVRRLLRTDQPSVAVLGSVRETYDKAVEFFSALATYVFAASDPLILLARPREWHEYQKSGRIPPNAGWDRISVPVADSTRTALAISQASDYGNKSLEVLRRHLGALIPDGRARDTTVEMFIGGTPASQIQSLSSAMMSPRAERTTFVTDKEDRITESPPAPDELSSTPNDDGRAELDADSFKK